MDKVVVMGGSGAGGSGAGVDTLIKDVFKAVLPVREITQELGIPFMDSPKGSSQNAPFVPVKPSSSKPTTPQA
jgi:hypothetical protein